MKAYHVNERAIVSGAGGNSSFVEVERVTRTIGDLTILDDINLSISEGEFISLLGPSGCGKTTLLRIASGLSPCDGGTLRVAGRDITRLPAHKRNMGVVFQNYALFPHLNVAENVAFGLKAQGRPREEISAAVSECLEMVQLSTFAERGISSLSGGQQQRVAVARALAVRPQLILLDEPFSALDRKLREFMQIELRRLLRSVKMTAIFVTHDQDEAMVMSDRIAVMNRGVIQDYADPASMYSRPISILSFDFLGLSTRLDARVLRAEGEMVILETKYGAMRAAAKFVSGAAVVIGIRPELIELDQLSSAMTDDRNRIRLRLNDIVFQGSKRYLHFAAVGEDRVIVEVGPTEMRDIRVDDETVISWPIEETLVFPSAG